MPYRACDWILSSGERAFWYPLYYAVKGKYRIFPKVRLSDVVRGPKRHEADRYWFNRIAGFHLDFVICDPETTRPLLVIELDDSTHSNEKSRLRDAFKDRVLRDAGLKVLRIQAAMAYEPEWIKLEIERLLTLPPPDNMLHEARRSP